MRSKLVLLLTAALTLAGLLVGCQSGVSPELYEEIKAQLSKAQAEAQAKIEEERNIADAVEVEKEAVLADLEEALEQAEELEAEVESLKEQYELTGATPAEVAEKIVRNYHETHVYSTYDQFICGDMSAEIWNMLKAQGISARLVVGNKDVVANGILDSDHAWVLAEVSPGEYLALETTAGVVIPESENALYYYGWYFDNPTSFKGYNEKVREYNTIVGIRNQIAEEVNDAADQYNNATSQAEADKWMAVYEKLKELQTAQEDRLNGIKAEIDSLAKPLQ